MDDATQRILPRHSAVIGTLAMLAAKQEVRRADHDIHPTGFWAKALAGRRRL